jgi:nitrogen fixation protein FixH
MKPRFHWGTGVLFVFTLFVLGVAGMVVTAFMNRVELVSDDYYQRGVLYEERLTVLRRSEAMADSIVIAASSGGIEIRFSREVARRLSEGRVSLYRPSDQGMDRVLSVALDSAGYQRVPMSPRDGGMWKVRVSWVAESLDFYREAAVVVQ